MEGSSALWVLLALATSSASAQTDGGRDRAVHIVPRESASTGATADIPTLPQVPNLRNTVDFKLDVFPGPYVALGTKMSFRVATNKAGYLLLLDVDASGKLSQIYPNLLSLAEGDTRGEEPNRIASDNPVVIPRAGSKAYEFVASSPRGIGMVVAVFCETPLDVIDLPDVPSQLVGTSEAVTFVRDTASTLRVVTGDGSGGFQDPKLSFNAAFYTIR